MGTIIRIDVYFRSENVVGGKPTNPCVGYPECQTEFNGTLVPYHTNDTCSVQEFSKCQDKCPEASCQFVKYTQNQVGLTFHYQSVRDRLTDVYLQDYSWMQFTNLFGLYWGVFFFSAFGEMVLAGVFSQVILASQYSEYS